MAPMLHSRGRVRAVALVVVFAVLLARCSAGENVGQQCGGDCSNANPISELNFRFTSDNFDTASATDGKSCLDACGNKALSDSKKYEYWEFNPGTKECKCFLEDCKNSETEEVTEKREAGRLCLHKCPCESAKKNEVRIENARWRVTDSAPGCTVVNVGESKPNNKECSDACFARGDKWWEWWEPTKKCTCCSDCPVGHFTWPVKPPDEPAQWTPIIFQGAQCSVVIDDPHFVGAHGTRFDFNGELDKHYCLVTDRGLHINALFRGYKTGNTAGASVDADGKGVRSWMSDLGLVWRDHAKVRHTLYLAARRGNLKTAPGLLASAELDGAAVGLPSSPGVALDVAGATLKFLGVGEANGQAQEDWSLVIAGQTSLRLEVRPALQPYQLKDDAVNHFNLYFQSLNATRDVHGIMGQTFRSTPSQLLRVARYSALSSILRRPVRADGDSGLGFLDGKTKDYESSGALEPDCKMTAFA